MSKMLYAAAAALFVVSVFLLGTLAYRFVVTDMVVLSTRQDRVDEALSEFRTEPAQVVDTSTVDRDRGLEYWSQKGSGVDASATLTAPLETLRKYPDLLFESPAELGEVEAVITIPAVDMQWPVVEGVGVQQLRQGPGHMPWTPLPGQPGNAVISGHRTTYGAPFNRLDELRVGDMIWVETSVGAHSYQVREIHTVSPDTQWVDDQDEVASLTLTTCWPEFSSSERLVVVADMVAGPNFRTLVQGS